MHSSRILRLSNCCAGDITSTAYVFKLTIIYIMQVEIQLGFDSTIDKYPRGTLWVQRSCQHIIGLSNSSICCRSPTDSWRKSQLYDRMVLFVFFLSAHIFPAWSPWSCGRFSHLLHHMYVYLLVFPSCHRPSSPCAYNSSFKIFCTVLLSKTVSKYACQHWRIYVVSKAQITYREYPNDANILIFTANLCRKSLYSVSSIRYINNWNGK